MSKCSAAFYVGVDLDMIITSVVRHTKFTPEVIDKLYIDEIDHHGIIYWFNDAKLYAEQIEKSIKPKK